MADKRLQAFQLGWTLSEILGRVRRGARPPRSQKPRPPSYAPRLSVSTGTLRTSTDQFNEAVVRLEALARALGLIGEKDPPDVPFRAPIERLKRVLAREEGAQFGPPSRLRQELQEWSLIARARLLAQDMPLAEAMNTGASLADTFWYMRQVSKPPAEAQVKPRRERIDAQQSEKVPKGHDDEDWRNLLSDYRLTVMRRRLMRLTDALPPYVAGTLIHHLRHWQIGRELAYGAQGKLYRLSRSRRSQHETPRLLPGDENAVQKALERQIKRWQDMLFGWRPPDQFLWWIDRQSIGLLHSLALALLFVVVGAGLGLLAYVWGCIINLVVGPAVLDVLTTGELDDRLKLLAAAAGWLTTMLAASRAVLGWVPRAYRWLDQNLTAWFVARRTLVKWDSEYLKHRRKDDNDTT